MIEKKEIELLTLKISSLECLDSDWLKTLLDVDLSWKGREIVFWLSCNAQTKPKIPPYVLIRCSLTLNTQREYIDLFQNDVVIIDVKEIIDVGGKNYLKGEWDKSVNHRNGLNTKIAK